jgi:hypothetical protein
MAGLDPAIHALFCRERFKTWMPGTGPAMMEFIAPTFFGRQSRHHLRRKICLTGTPLEG